jgi:dihydroneopterin aldolase
VADERWDLIERVATRVADSVLGDERIYSVEVTVHKPDAPIKVGFADVSVTVRRDRV